MRYLSTRGHADRKSFCQILLEGLAPDGGLYLPEHYPQVSLATLAEWRGLPYADLAFEILSLYIDDIPADDLRRICRETYTEAVFGSAEITPVRELGQGVHIQALSNGPTLAFKDMAMQLLGALFEYELGRRGQRLNILGATSGDTGSAAEHAMRGKAGVRVFMLSPHGRMSEFQQAQMFSLQDANIHNLAVDGVFDDCQDMVKAVSADAAFKQRYAIGTVNSINWARLLAQVVYYFKGYLSVASELGQPVSFTVPSGNFGNVCAGHVARMMGLPIAHLVVATNENDVLDEFFRTGHYRVRAASETYETSSPSMDISKASNFERFVFDVLARDASAVAQAFGQAVPEQGGFSLPAERFEALSQFGFASARSTHADRLHTIAKVRQTSGQWIDPHTADGVKAAWQLRQDQGWTEPMIVLETALPAKFSSTLEEACGERPALTPGQEALLALPRRFTRLGTEVAALKAFVASHCPEA